MKQILEIYKNHDFFKEFHESIVGVDFTFEVKTDDSVYVGKIIVVKKSLYHSFRFIEKGAGFSSTARYIEQTPLWFQELYKVAQIEQDKLVRIRKLVGVSSEH